MEKTTENTLVAQEVKVKQVWFDEHRVYFELLDGRAVVRHWSGFPGCTKQPLPKGITGKSLD